MGVDTPDAIFFELVPVRIHWCRSRGDQASSASGHVRHVAIISTYTKIWGLETCLEITCDEFVYMSTQWLHC